MLSRIFKNNAINAIKISKPYLLILLLGLPSFAGANVSNAKLYGEINFPRAEAVARKIHQLKKGDTLELKINSGGGIVEAGDIIRKAIRQTKGDVIAVIEGQALSEGAFVAIACHKVEGKGKVMFHVGFQYDDNGNPYSNPQSWGYKQAVTMTKPILTKQEQHRMVNLKQDIFMSVDTLKQRLAQKEQAQKTA
jgi:hypothetical protein